MNIIRRAISIFLIVAVMGGVVYIDQRQTELSEGASRGIVSMAGFPHSIKSNRISSSWFCPGAAAGDGLDSASVFISNPSDTAITAAVSFLSNSPMESQTVEVPARNHSVVDVLRGRTVGVIVPVVGHCGTTIDICRGRRYISVCFTNVLHVVFRRWFHSSRIITASRAD